MILHLVIDPNGKCKDEAIFRLKNAYSKKDKYWGKTLNSTEQIFKHFFSECVKDIIHAQKNICLKW